MQAKRQGKTAAAAVSQAFTMPTSCSISIVQPTMPILPIDQPANMRRMQVCVDVDAFLWLNACDARVHMCPECACYCFGHRASTGPLVIALLSRVV